MLISPFYSHYTIYELEDDLVGFLCPNFNGYSADLYIMATFSRVPAKKLRKIGTS